MPAVEIPNRSDILFGRERDLQALAKRADQKGLTAVVARPMMGKSWLLAELQRGLSDHWLVGSAKSYGQTSDLTLRAVVDLYQRWNRRSASSQRRS